MQLESDGAAADCARYHDTKYKSARRVLPEHTAYNITAAL